MTRWLKWGVSIGLVVGLQTIGCAQIQTRPQEDAVTLAVAPEPIEARDAAELYGELFVRVQTVPVFDDSKLFVDMIPRESPEKIMSDFKAKNPRTKRELKEFVSLHFLPPASPLSGYKPSPGRDIDKHIRDLWTYLKREPHEEATAASSLIALPHSYVVPGGRFREIYYWDSYFTQLGLLADGEDELFRNMVKNFAHLVQATGRIPNGNRDYYRGRSQPPFFSHMVALWRSHFGDRSATEFLPALVKEHDFWMAGAKGLDAGQARARVVRVRETGYLNRYWDDEALPRPEAYKEDVALAEKAATRLGRSREEVYRDLRAGAESGWDYSSRWFKDPTDFATIQTTSFVPVDLNSLLFHLEETIADLHAISGDQKAAIRYRTMAEDRRRLINELLWDDKSGTYKDYDWRARALAPRPTVAMVVPLFTGVASQEQAGRVATALEKDFLKPGGLVTTTVTTDQQWDAPNGWAPHQWMGYAGLKRYGRNELANEIRKRWLNLNRRVYRTTGKMMEKYNVIDLSLKSGGGEYPLQDGFGWTNGVYRAMSTPDTSR